MGRGYREALAVGLSLIALLAGGAATRNGGVNDHKLSVRTTTDVTFTCSMEGFYLSRPDAVITRFQSLQILKRLVTAPDDKPVVLATVETNEDDARTGPPLALVSADVTGKVVISNEGEVDEPKSFVKLTLFDLWPSPELLGGYVCNATYDDHPAATAMTPWTTNHTLSSDFDVEPTGSSNFRVSSDKGLSVTCSFHFSPSENSSSSSFNVSIIRRQKSDGDSELVVASARTTHDNSANCSSEGARCWSLRMANVSELHVHLLNTTRRDGDVFECVVDTPGGARFVANDTAEEEERGNNTNCGKGGPDTNGSNKHCATIALLYCIVLYCIVLYCIDS